MNSYLKKCVATAVAVIAMGGSWSAYAQDASRGAVTMGTVNAYAWDNPYDVAIGGLSWTDLDYSTWEQGSSGGGGGETSADPQPRVVPCAELASTKPEQCPNPIPFPSGHRYGKELFAGGSALAKLIYFTDHLDGVSPRALVSVRVGLEYHTELVRSEFASQDTASKSLLLSVQHACMMQHDDDEPLRKSGWLIGPSAQEKKCVDALEALRGEVGHDGFTAWFAKWLEREGLTLGDFGVPTSVVDALTPDRSIVVKAAQAVKDMKCAKWWQDVEANKCGVP